MPKRKAASAKAAPKAKKAAATKADPITIDSDSDSDDGSDDNVEMRTEVVKVWAAGGQVERGRVWANQLEIGGGTGRAGGGTRTGITDALPRGGSLTGDGVMSRARCHAPRLRASAAGTP